MAGNKLETRTWLEPSELTDEDNTMKIPINVIIVDHVKLRWTAVFHAFHHFRSDRFYNFLISSSNVSE